MADVSKYLDSLLRLVERVKEETQERLNRCAEVIAEKSDYYCPKDTLALVNSRKIAEVEGLVAVEISYGGDSTAETVSKDKRYGPGPVRVYWAAYVHEVLSHHHDDPTRAKFLEHAAEESRAECREIMGRPFGGAISRR